MPRYIIEMPEPKNCDEYGESCNGAFRYKEFMEEE